MSHLGSGEDLRRPTADHGFTLAEVMVVVLILGILSAVALPTLLGARQRSKDAAAVVTLRRAATAAVLASDFRADFRLATGDVLALGEPSLDFLAASEPSTGPDVVSVDASEQQRWVAAVRSDSGTCFAVVLGTTGQTQVEGDACDAASIGTPAPSAPPLPFAYNGSINSATTGMCLGVVSRYLVQQACSGSLPSFTITTRSDGYSTISVSDGTCFGTTGPVRNARVIEEICQEADDQLWLVVSSFEGSVQFKNKETGYCMDVSGNKTTVGTPIIQWGIDGPPSVTCKPTTTANNHNFDLV